ncbi:anti-repressor SinI family protein [Fictibacillus terranigra]|uniref:Anti-repressor SinI family protein n=1 Tax=Fictibacillus terranigra TaxID=3058424 RepID=A0ABT8E3B4_9BACL|nr:anti-repressor SinI family protein [Fictibacillus sp. CENA-BCM004]MDN4072396.1 anti-repressor SinI family protein [Fictibacillus sp. CENA-BCM004]
MQNLNETHLDQEWVVLILQAKKLGLSLEEVRKYLQESYIQQNMPLVKATSG